MRKEESDKKSTVQSYDTLYADPASAKDASTMREDYIADREKCLEKLKDME